MFGRGSATNITMQRELEEIVADLPPSTASVNSGPASTSQHSPSLKIHCSNPNDISRVTSFKHFQECVIGVTKDGLYFMADRLERMFPEDATRTKVLLGSFNAIQLLKDHGASVTNDHSLRGMLLYFPKEAMMGAFQDPFFTCDTPAPLPAPLASIYPGSSASGLILGANLKRGLINILSGKLNVWQVLSTAGVQSFFQGLVIGFVDEILGTLVPVRYRNRLRYMKNLFQGASALIGTSVLVYMIVNKKTTLTAAVISVLIAYVCNMVGGAVGTGLGNLLQWVKRNYFNDDNNNNENNHNNNNIINNDNTTYLPSHVNLQVNANQTTPSIIVPSSDIVHYCGQDNNGFMHIGLCINCNIQPAVFGFVHSRDNVAHSAFCLGCSSLYRGSTCVCCAEVSSTYYFSPASTTCSARTCIAAAACVTCDEEGSEVPKTASVWRLKKSEETQVTHRTVALDVRYCQNHTPLATHNDLFRYGRLYSTGYI